MEDGYFGMLRNMLIVIFKSVIISYNVQFKGTDKHKHLKMLICEEKKTTKKRERWQMF